MFYSIDMLVIKTNQTNSLVVTVSQNSTIPNPEWLFSFTHIFSKQQVRFIPTDISVSKTRYDEFVFIEGQGVGEIAFPFEGQYNYAIYQQPSGSGNLNPALSDGAVEYGTAIVIATSADTTNEYYIEFVSNNEFNSNYIFAPNELNPPSPTPTATQTPTPTQTQTQTSTQTPTQTSTQTPTPSVTAGLTPTATETPTPTPTPTNTSTPSQTPSNTATQTQTQTPTPTQTPTNTVTQTTTPTQTPSQTNTQTPTVTRTPTQTPSNTPNALCNLFVSITGATNPIFNGTYFYDSISYINSSNVIVAGADPSGASAILYKQSGNNLYLGRNYVSAFGQPWANLSGVTTQLVQSASITDGVYVYPQSGPGTATYYLTYPPVCTLTPTPTSTQTPTPSQTQTQTPTNTSSPTQTPTVTQTPTNTASQTATPTNTASQTATPTQTPTPSITASPSQTPTNTMTPTNTASQTNTASPTQTPTQTSTMTPTPSSTPAPFTPSGMTNLQLWYISTSGASASSWTNYGLLGGSLSQGTASFQPQIAASTLGSYSGNAVQFVSRDFMTTTISSTNFSSCTVFLVASVNTTSANGWAISLYGSGAGNNTSWDWQSYNTSLSQSITRKNPGGYLSASRTKPEMLLATSGTSNSFFTASFNDSIPTSASTTYTGTTVTNVDFGYDPGSSTSNNIEIFEFLAYNRVLTTTEFGNVMNYLKTKYQYSTW